MSEYECSSHSAPALQQHWSETHTHTHKNRILRFSMTNHCLCLSSQYWRAPHPVSACKAARSGPDQCSHPLWRWGLWTAEGNAAREEHIFNQRSFSHEEQPFSSQLVTHLKLLLAGSHIDIRAPDDQSLSRTLLAAGHGVSSRLKVND